MVDKLIGHITQPCKTEVDGTIHDLGDFWISRAEEVIGTISDEGQRTRLQKCINIYKK